MQIKDFNILVNLGEVPANDVAGTFIDQTELDVKTSTAYLLNPATILACKFSEFYPHYWSSYQHKWISDSMFPGSMPEIVKQHVHNHFRATAIAILKKQGNSLENIRKMVNIAMGYGFTLSSGIVNYTLGSGVYSFEQYPFLDTADSNAFVLNYTNPQVNFSPWVDYYNNTSEPPFAGGTVVDFFTPLCEAAITVDWYDPNEEDVAGIWDVFDSSHAIPLIRESTNDLLDLDHFVNKRKIVTILGRYSAGLVPYYSFSYLARLLKSIIPKDVILFFKQHN